MVKIRYMDLPAGLHVSAEKRGRTTIIYLLPGLTAEQRRAAIVRARSSGRMGLGPELPPAALALALVADRLRTTVRNGLAATRSHPVVLLPALILVVSSAVVFMVVSLVSVTVPQAVPQIGDLFGGGHQHYRPVTPGSSASSSEGTGRDPAADPRSTPSAPAVPDPVTSLPSSVMPPAGSSPSPIPVLSPAPSSSPSPSPSPSPSASPQPSPAATCVKLGPLGLCVSL